jgi:hypothetical protein
MLFKATRFFLGIDNLDFDEAPLRRKQQQQLCRHT